MAQSTARGNRRAGSNGVGIVLIVLGILFLANQLIGFDLWSVAWPLGIVLIGLSFFAAMLIGGKSLSGLAIPGSIVTVVGLILAYQDAFDRYETWSYAWAFIVIAAGLGISIKGFWTDDAKSFQGGLRVMAIGAVLAVVFGVFFELIIGFSGVRIDIFRDWFWSILLIALGVGLLLRSGSRRELR